MGAKNRVIAGDYVGKAVDPSFNGPVIKTGVGEKIHLNHSTVESYELVTDEHRKSAKSGAARGLVGGVL